MNEIEQKLAEELGINPWELIAIKGCAEDPTRHDYGLYGTSAKLWRKCCELMRLALQLGEAAREINCAGPVPHRIRMLKKQHADHIEEIKNRAIALGYTKDQRDKLFGRD